MTPEGILVLLKQPSTVSVLQALGFLREAEISHIFSLIIKSSSVTITYN